MIINQKPITLGEAKELVVETEFNKGLVEYFKDFTKLSKEKSISFREELESLKNHKVKEDKIVKIVDLVPQDSEDLSKIFNDVSLSEEETQSILNISKNY